MEYNETANETIPIIKRKNADIPSTRISRSKKGMTFGTIQLNGLPVRTLRENMIAKIEPIIEGTKIACRANLPLFEKMPSRAPLRNSRIAIWNKTRLLIIIVSQYGP